MPQTKLSWFTKLSLNFIKRYRITLLIFAVILGVGFFTYTTILRKEGYPEIQYPGVIIQATYIVNNADKVNTELTEPLYKAVSGISEVKKVTATSGDNYSVIFAELEDNSSSETKLKEMRDAINTTVKLPSDQIVVNYSTIKASSYDGKNDYIFTISHKTKSYKDMQLKGEEIVKELTKVAGVKQAEVKNVISEQTNPETGEKIAYQSNFGLVGYQKNGSLVFEKSIEIGVISDSSKVGTIELSDNIRQALTKMQDDKKLEGYTVNFGGDGAGTVKTQISSLNENAIGGIVAVLIVLALLINWRASVVTALFIPTTLAATFLTFYFIGYSLNTVSMFGLILVLGLFVDDATVIVEAIDYQKKHGAKGITAVKQAIQSVGAADITGTLCTLLVFVPMLFISGIMGKFIIFMPVTVIIALALSLTIALTIVPFLTNVFIADEKTTKASAFSRILADIVYAPSRLVLKTGELISKIVDKYLSKYRYTVLVLILAAVFIGAGVSYAGKLAFSVFPPGKDSDKAMLSIQLNKKLSVTQAEAEVTRLNKTIAKDYGKYFKLITYFSPDNSGATAIIDLVPMKERDIKAGKLVEEMNAKYGNIPDTKVKFTLVSAAPSADEFPFTMQIFAEDQAKLETTANKIKDFIKDKEVATGVKVGEVIFDQNGTITAIDGKRYINLKAKFVGESDTNSILKLKEIIQSEFTTSKLKDLGLSEDALGFDFGMESENLSSFYSTIFAFIAAIAILYGLLVFKFNSFAQPLLVFMAIPLAFPLVFPGLYYTNNYLSFFVMIGLIGLVGIVVNNTVMLVDFANQGREAGLTIRKSIVRAVKLRFRPLFVTSITTIAGLLPLALQDPVWESLAFTIIFGLVSSTILVILIFPAFYAIVEKFRQVKFKILPELREYEYGSEV